MDKQSFKSSVMYLLKEEVEGLSQENKLLYMKKWIRDYELKHDEKSDENEKQEGLKVGVLVKSTFNKIVKANLLSNEMILLLQDERYSKTTFDINYPFLKKVQWGTSFSDQRKVNGYNRYWQEDLIINGERYFVCSQWYDRNKPKFIRWVNILNKS